MRIGVLGAGAIGCYLGGKLALAGHDVIFVGRLGDEIRAHGLTLTDYTGARAVLEAARVRYESEASALSDVDVVLVTVKSAATEDAARPLASLLKKSATLVSLQNGVSNPDRLRGVLPGHVVVAGMVPFNVAHGGEGKFHNGTSGPLSLERRGAEGALEGALRGAGFAVELHDDLTRIQWTKLVINLNNAVNALAGIPLRAQLDDRRYRRAMALCVREGLTVLRAAGIKPVRVGRILPSVAPFVLGLPDVLFRVIAARMVSVDDKARSSMLDDLDRRRITEVDWLNGEILRLAEAHGVPAPVNRTITALVKQAETARAGSPKIPADRLLDLLA